MEDQEVINLFELLRKYGIAIHDVPTNGKYVSANDVKEYISKHISELRDVKIDEILNK